MSDGTQDEVAALKGHIEELAEALFALQIRHSALEWFVEQHLANTLLKEGPANADAFLDAISHDDGRAWRATEEGVQSPPDAARRALWAHIVHIAEKVRTRVHQGPRRS